MPNVTEMMMIADEIVSCPKMTRGGGGGGGGGGGDGGKDTETDGDTYGDTSALRVTATLKFIEVSVVDSEQVPVGAGRGAAVLKMITGGVEQHFVWFTTR